MFSQPIGGQAPARFRGAAHLPLLAEWLCASHLRAGRLSLEEADDNPARFARGLLTRVATRACPIPVGSPANHPPAVRADLAESLG